MTVKIDTKTKYQTIKGFGASACWNFQVLGLEDDQTIETAMEMLYGKSGLDMNIVRYNVGGGSKELGSFGGSNTAATETFFIKERFTGDYSAFANPDNYDFTRDAAALKCVKVALSKGVSNVVCFANSPHYYMTVNGACAGRYGDNLYDVCTAAHKYLTSPTAETEAALKKVFKRFVEYDTASGRKNYSELEKDNIPVDENGNVLRIDGITDESYYQTAQKIVDGTDTIDDWKNRSYDWENDICYLDYTLEELANKFSFNQNGVILKETNLKEDAYRAFSDYLLIIAKGIDDLIKSWGYDNVEIVISPTNEPQWKWGGRYCNQEGCHFEAKQLAAFYNVFANALSEFNTANGTAYKYELYETGGMYMEDNTYNQDYVAEILKYDYAKDIDTICAHDYWVADWDDATKIKFNDFVRRSFPGAKIAMTELCEMQPGRFDTYESALYLANILKQDFSLLNATEWSWWLGVSAGDYNDGLVYWDKDPESGENKLSVLKRYYAFGQYSKFIKEGAIRVKCDIDAAVNENFLANNAFLNPDGTIAVVVINYSYDRYLSFKGHELVKAVVTSKSGMTWEEVQPDENGKLFLEPDSITTLILK